LSRDRIEHIFNRFAIGIPSGIAQQSSAEELPRRVSAK
jgi:hypothetical protein